MANPAVSTVFHTALMLHNHLGRVIEARTPRPDFIQDAIDLERSPFMNRLQAVVEICSADIEAPLKLNIVENLFGGHVVMAERGIDGDYLFTHAGRKLRTYDRSLMSALQGRSFRHPDDKQFGTWTANRYKDIHGGDAPIAESVSALITFRDRVRQRYYYDRLIVPMIARSGADALLIAVNHN